MKKKAVQGEFDCHHARKKGDAACRRRPATGLSLPRPEYLKTCTTQLVQFQSQ